MRAKNTVMLLAAAVLLAAAAVGSAYAAAPLPSAISTPVAVTAKTSAARAGDTDVQHEAQGSETGENGSGAGGTSAQGTRR